MSVNKYLPHVWVIPEDDANRELANGFQLHRDLRLTAMDIRPVAGGWHQVVRAVQQNARDMRNFPERRLVLLLDLDGQGEARERQVREQFPDDLRDRIYLLSTRDQPEKLKTSKGLSFESLGTELAEACATGMPGTWRNEHLQHNLSELDRLVVDVRPFLFPTCQPDLTSA